MPRGPGKKENYNLDYSRFNSFDRDEADEVSKEPRQPPEDEADAAGGPGIPEMRDLLRTMPVELQEAYHLMSIAKANGDTKAQQRASELALKAVEKGGPEVRNTFMNNVAKQMPEIAGRLSKDMSGVDLDPKSVMEGLQNDMVNHRLAQDKSSGNLDDAEERIEKLRREMEEGQKSTRAELDELQKKQEELERIRNPEEFFKFMKDEGITQEDLQRIFSGDEEHMKARFNETMEKKEEEKKQTKKKSEEALDKVNQLHGALFGEDHPEESPAPEPAPEKPARRAPSPPREPEPTIPMYRLQYQKDEAGKYTAVDLKCTLPGIADMSAINLDIAERHLRISTVASAPRYAVNAGPFPVLVDPSGARAKYSKKREELSISVPAKLN